MYRPLVAEKTRDLTASRKETVTLSEQRESERACTQAGPGQLHRIATC